MKGEQTSIEELGGQAMQALRSYFEDPEPDKAEETRAKIAASVLSTTARLKQTQGAQDALAWSMATTLLAKEQLGEYVRVSMPTSPLVKALPVPK